MIWFDLIGWSRNLSDTRKQSHHYDVDAQAGPPAEEPEKWLSGCSDAESELLIRARENFNPAFTSYISWRGQNSINAF